MIPKKIRVLVIDDSALIRETLTNGLNRDPGIEVIGTAADPYVARDKIVKYKPDVLTLDVEMPRMDGVEFLRKLMPQYPLPVVMVSALTEKGAKITLDALEAGAVDFVEKPKSNVIHGLKAMLLELRTKIKIASTANVSFWKHKRQDLVKDNKILNGTALTKTTNKVIAIGASTGGTEAIKKVITNLPVTTPGIVVVQHMPAGFTRSFAERMNSNAQMEVKEAENNDRIITGRILIAPGGKHMQVRRSGGTYKVKVAPGDTVSGHCPSVDVLMQSTAENVGINSVGIILTGMGQDGAEGMLAMRKNGARTIAQDEATSVVFGMPRKAYENGGAEYLVPVHDIAKKLISILEEQEIMH